MSDESKQNLVVGASGFLGSHLTQNLANSGALVKALIRPTSDKRGIEGCAADICYGDVRDKASLADAMKGCDTVYYCVVDTRAWLRDSTALYETNVEGLRNALDTALSANVRRFIFTGSMATIGLNSDRTPNESDAFNWHDIAPDYVLSRVESERLLLDYCSQFGLPGISMCVGNTYGPGDFQPTPHGGFIRAVARGQTRTALNCGAPIVDIRDAAEAMILAAERGRIGERYIIASNYVTQPEMHQQVAHLAGLDHKIKTIPIWMAHIMARINETIAQLRGRETRLTSDAVLLSHIFKELDATKAKTELGWAPRPIEETLQDAVQFFTSKERAIQ